MTQNNKLNLGVIAASGRMGKAILKLIEEEPNVSLAASYGRNSSNDLDDFIAKSGVIIDFSTPKLMSELLEKLKDNPKPLVSGTTGHNNFEQLIELSRKTAVLWAPNMSMGSNLMIKFLESNLPNLNKYEICISEMHHKHKKDSLSGTAKLMRDIVKKYDPEKKIQTYGVRIGEVHGKHSIIFVGNGETLEIIHTAENRSTFAVGAIRAALFLQNAPSGLYSMKDVFNYAL